MSGVEAVAEIRTDAGLIYGRLLRDLPVGTMLYSQATVDTLRAQLEAAEADFRERFEARTIDWNEAGNARDSWMQRAKDAEARAEAAEAQLAKEAERIDWLAHGFKTCTVYMSGQHPWEPSHKVRGLRGPSFRAAIDAAMSRTKEETK